MPIPDHWSIPGYQAPHNHFSSPGIWDDGEWVSYDEIQEKNEELDAYFEGGHLEDLLMVCRDYHEMTGHHLPIYRKLAVDYAAVRFGFHASQRLEKTKNKNRNKASSGISGDGRKVILLQIDPSDPDRDVAVTASEAFEAIILARITPEFLIEARWIDRKHLPAAACGLHQLSWMDSEGPATSSLPPQVCNANGIKAPEYNGDWISKRSLHARQKDHKSREQLVRGMLNLCRENLEGISYNLHGSEVDLPGLYGPLGELYATLRFGIDLHGNPHYPGSDGTIGDLLVEVKTIGPEDGNWEGRVRVMEKGRFDALAIVKIDQDFRIDAKLIRRDRLPPAVDGIITVPWKDFTCDYRAIAE